MFPFVYPLNLQLQTFQIFFFTASSAILPQLQNGRKKGEFSLVVKVMPKYFESRVVRT